MTDSSISARIAGLALYPVKSCRGLVLELAEARPTGLASRGIADREWMVVDEDGRFLTQREYPALCRVTVTADGGMLTLEATGLPALALAPGRGTSRRVVVWRSEVRGFDAGDEAAGWFARLLGRPARLVRFDRSHRRACNPDYAGDSGAHTLFADGYPVLVIGTASLADLNARLAARGAEPVPMNRFRPNIVIDGLSPYDEDHLETIDTAEVTLRPVKPCTRCVITTTDQASGSRDTEPLATLAGYRHDAQLGGVTFGMNAVVLRAGTLADGEEARCTWRF